MKTFTLSVLSALAFATCASAQDAPSFKKIVYQLTSHTTGLIKEEATLTIENPTATGAKVTLEAAAVPGSITTKTYELDAETMHALIQLAGRVKNDEYQTYTTHLGLVTQPLTHFSLAIEGLDGKVRGGDGYRNHIDTAQRIDQLLMYLDSIRFKASAVPFQTREREVQISIVPHVDPNSSETFVKVKEGQYTVTRKLRPASVVEELRAYGDGATVILTGRSVLEYENGAPFLVESHRRKAKGINQSLGN